MGVPRMPGQRWCAARPMGRCLDANRIDDADKSRVAVWYL